MNTINHEYYVSLEVAKLLKEAGFDWKCNGVFLSEDGTQYAFIKADAACDNNNSKYNSKPQINYKTSFPSSSGSYMDTRPVYLKRKNNMAYNDEEDDNDESGEPNYSNSIYNINRKKKKKNNNYRNKYNKKDYDEEDEDEDNDYEGNQRQIPQCTGFQSAITITNKLTIIPI